MPAQKILRQSEAQIADGEKQYASFYNNEFNHIKAVVDSHADDIDNRYTKAEVDSLANNLGTTATVAAGTAFPSGTFTSGQLFWRTDELKMYSYDSVSSSWKPVLPLGAGSGTDADTVDGKHASDLMNNTKIYGNATYTDSIAASGTLTKTIPLGGTFKHGKLVLFSSSGQHGISVSFGTDNTKTLVSGAVLDQIYTGYTGPSSWSRRMLGNVTSGNYGHIATGQVQLEVSEVYISGTDLIISFRNTHASTAYSLNCAVDWEVW